MDEWTTTNNNKLQINFSRFTLARASNSIRSPMRARLSTYHVKIFFCFLNFMAEQNRRRGQSRAPIFVLLLVIGTKCVCVCVFAWTSTFTSAGSLALRCLSSAKKCACAIIKRVCSPSECYWEQVWICVPRKNRVAFTLHNHIWTIMCSEIIE